MKTTQNKKHTRIEIEKPEEKLMITHKGSVWQFEIGIDKYDDLTIKRIHRNQKI